MPARLARPRRAAVATATCCGLLLAGAALPSGAVEAPAVAGAAGIGDAYFPTDGNGGYDVSHYDISDSYDVATGQLDGTTVVTAETTENLSSFNLDLVLAVDGVELGVGGGAPVRLTRGSGPGTFHKSGKHELVVRPAAPTPAGTGLTVRVDYHGRPADIGYRKNKPWLRNAGETMATNEPQIAPWWFAANDHPSDKATFDIELAVPSGQQAISNGVLLGHEDDGAWSTWRWRMAQPMAPYLAFFAAGRFVVEQGTRAGFPYVNAVSKQLSAGNRTRALKLMRRTPKIVAWLQSQFGDYPYESTGGVTTALYSGFALENQSRPTYPYLGNGSYARTTVVHELAHQWFGDQVSVHRWRDIWLNEGFASWAEWRYDEAHGRRSAQRTLLNHYAAYMRSDPLWKLEIGDPGPKKLFAYPVYERGAMALQALRHRIGNRDFMRVLRTWVIRHQDGTGRVAQFRRLAEDVSGQHLRRFFKVWLHTGQKPARTKANGLR
ncbi:MAG: M1 family metallopeptidase [Nocardioides sp.]